LNFAVIGNDARMDYVAEQLYFLGCQVTRNLNNLSYKSNIIVPPPVNDELWNDLEPYADKISIIYGGSISEKFKEKNIDVPIFDYLSWHNVISENANLTAKGIIKEAISMGAYLKDSKIIITGFGYCGKALACELNYYDTEITIAVRNNIIKNEILNLGYSYIDLNSLSDNNLKQYNYIFNTVPALVINKDVIDCLDDDIMIFDIASKPGGVDFEYCNTKSITSVLSLGIPGKKYPKEAGYLIANACFQHCKNLS